MSDVRHEVLVDDDDDQMAVENENDAIEETAEKDAPTEADEAPAKEDMPEDNDEAAVDDDDESMDADALRKLTRAELDEYAVEQGLNPDDYRNRNLLLEALGA